ncbi:hypothetical protein [Bifidobacterium simiiventris]|uniref:hypothetical protein n=1 Tax=Bifidobacterium simiiventris TaxID=2834434 RepID=UPI001C58F03D|nr:hypothetical protein [Bifidobacterium simiiventris]MBW3077691.1 hypothetical protein [Bifidobacterium simiiventris]
MATKVRMQFNSAGFRQILNSQPVANLIGQQAQRIKTAAGDGFEVDGPRPMNYGGGRMGAFVTAVTHQARTAEARDKTLTRAVGGGA